MQSSAVLHMSGEGTGDAPAKCRNVNLFLFLQNGRAVEMEPSCVQQAFVNLLDLRIQLRLKGLGWADPCVLFPQKAQRQKLTTRVRYDGSG